VSWERSHYEATCKACGHKGEKIRASDDWGRSEVEWAGFSVAPELASAERVMRKKIDANEFARCKCGSTDIEVGEYLRSS
jgi:hypothetical protein